MEFDNIGLVLTDSCNARCEMCCAGREELRSKQHTLTPEELDGVMAQVKACPSISTIGITGGEPMLHPELVQQVCDYDFGRSMKVTLKTNGFWGKDPVAAEEFIERNLDKITYVSFSYDEFHCKYISLDAIKTLIDICWDHGIMTDVIGCFLKDSMTAGTILDMLGESAYKCHFGYQPVMRTGLAENIPEEKFIRPYRTDHERLPCSVGLKHTLLINTALEVYPCCSQCVEGTILKLGNLHEERLTEVLEHTVHNRLLVELFTKGLTPLLELVDDDACPKAFSTPCEACEFLFRDARHLERIADAFERQDHEARCA